MVLFVVLAVCRNGSYVFKEHYVYFYKPTEPAIHQQECVKDEQPLICILLASGSSPTGCVFYFS